MDLNQVTIPSLNVERSAEFYKKLALKLIVEAFPKYARFECLQGNSTFSIHKVEKLPKGELPKIYFEVENVNEAVERLKSVGITFESEAEEKPWLWTEAHLVDPDSNPIIIYHGGENRKNPPWRIKD